jgi:hypothetical protein
MHITSTLDPITLHDAPRSGSFHLQEGDLDIYFESQETLRMYKEMPVEHPGVDLAYNLDNPTEDCGTDWN